MDFCKRGHCFHPRSQHHSPEWLAVFSGSFASTTSFLLCFVSGHGNKAAQADEGSLAVRFLPQAETSCWIPEVPGQALEPAEWPYCGRWDCLCSLTPCGTTATALCLRFLLGCHCCIFLQQEAVERRSRASQSKASWRLLQRVSSQRAAATEISTVELTY